MICGRMADEEQMKRAAELFHEAYRRQMDGDLEGAISCYKRSIALHPTAEAHTFLGWTYSFQGRLEEAIAECKAAIAVDADFGNPYNDIGSYLIKLGQLDDAVPWLEAAIKAPRYEPRHYPHCNLAQVYWARGELRKAIEELERALALEPEYEHAQAALAAITKQLN
jgi:tetratricopeptide (TPR) repeat protein